MTEFKTEEERNAALAKLLALLVEKERRYTAEREAKRAAASKRQWFQDYYYQVQKFNRQRSCNHRKGGSQGARRQGTTNDFAVWMHRHITGEYQIKCMLCGWEVWNKPGWSYKWEVGMRMVKKSSNTPTASEIPAGTDISGLIPVPYPKIALERTEKGNRMFADWEPRG